MSLLNTPNVVSPSAKTASYTVLATDDLVPFLVTAAANATLPSSTGLYAGLQSANRTGGQGIVVIKNALASTANVTLVPASGDVLFPANVVLTPGQSVKCESDGQGTWNCSNIGGTYSITAPRGIHTGQHAAYVSTDGNNSTPVITETYVSEIIIPASTTVTGIALFNGSDVTGNVTVGLATAAGVPITAAKSASTAGAGTDAYQLVPFAAPYVAAPGTYFIQVQYSSGTARYNCHTLGTHAILVQTAQTYGTLTSFTPPTTFVTNVGNICGLY